MRLASVRIENLRSFKDETISLDDYTCLVGANGSGKSTVLCALNVFFRESTNAPADQDLGALREEDFHRRNTALPIKITVTFADLTTDELADFEHYARDGMLVVTAEAMFDPATNRAEVTQYGQRKGIKQFAPFFEALSDGAPAAQLKVIYSTMREAFPDLPSPGTKQAMEDALRSYESAHSALCTLIPSSEQFYGFTKGANRLEKYIQWVFVPAVKDAITEQVESKNTALGKLLLRAVEARSSLKEPLSALKATTKEKYLALIDEHKHALQGLSESLKQRLTLWAHPDASLRLGWLHDDKSVRIEEPFATVFAGEGAFEGTISRFGHGLQRCYLIALLQELAAGDSTKGPRLILACEEPELYQHPPQARHLSDVFQSLAEGNAQVITCTHSPHFVSGEAFEKVRVIRKDPASSCSVVAATTWTAVEASIRDATGKPWKTLEGVLARIHQALRTSINEMFFTPSLVLVEGQEDVAYITAYLALSGKWLEWRRVGCHIVPTDGKSHIIQPLAVARAFRIPTFIVFDADTHESDAEKRGAHERDNAAILRLCGVKGGDPMPSATYWGNDVVLWTTEISRVVQAEFGADWTKAKAKIEALYGHIPGLQKNSLFIADCMATAWEAGARSESLEKLCSTILEFFRPSVITTAESNLKD